MRLHVLGMAHTQTTKAYSHCAYTQKVRNFCRMMMDQGHEVFLYAGEENDVPCTEHIVCISERERSAALKGRHYLEAEHTPQATHWRIFNGRACGELATRAQQGDFLCVIFGFAQKVVADAYPILKTVEYGIGYHHTFAEHRVFESYAWMHTVYGAQKGSDRDGIWFDDVIHGYLDPAEFPLGTKRKDHLVYLGRVINRKGVNIAAQVAKATGRHLIVAGKQSDPLPPGCQHVGEVGPEARAKLLGEAYAVMAPSIYIEPFGNVAIEAMCCGTPVVTTDWGAYTETVVHGVTGFRCRSLQQFVDAIDDCGDMDRALIRNHAVMNFSLDVIGAQYHDYFTRLSTLWGKGWDELR